MIQISPNLIRTSSRRMSFDDIDNVRKENSRQTSMIEQMMSSSPETESSIVDSKEPGLEGRGSQQSQKETGNSQEKKTKTKTVKFGCSQKRKEVVAASAPSESLFSKEQVTRKKEPTFGQVGSLLAKGLLESGVLNTARTKKSPRGQGADDSAEPLQFETLPIGNQTSGIQTSGGGGRDHPHGLSFSLGIVPSKTGLGNNLTSEPLKIVPPPPPLPIERGISGGPPQTPKGFPLSSSTTSASGVLTLTVHIEGSASRPLKLKIPLSTVCKVQEVIQMVIDQFHKERELQHSSSSSNLEQSQSSRALSPPPPPPTTPAGSDPSQKSRSQTTTTRQASVSISESKTVDDEDLSAPPQAYELRLLDDDDGTPDMDMQPFAPSADIHKLNVKEVCLVRKQGYQEGSSSDSYMRLNTDAKIGVSAKKLNQMFIRVHMGNNEKYVISATKDMSLSDLFPLLVKKRQHVVSPGESKELNPEEYNWFYLSREGEDEVIETKTLLKDLESDNLRLNHKIPQGAFRSGSILDSSHSGASHPSFGIRPSMSSASLSGGVTPAHFTFTKETAYAYAEYRVIKTNARGRRQKRIIGIDATRIWNKDEGTVRHPFRLISTVKACEVLTAEPNLFMIEFSGKEKSRREYRTETQVDCAEIVAKIQWLMKNPPKS